MTGRRGASPIPPATMTRSRPRAASTGQPVPKGPRTPIAGACFLAHERMGRLADGAHRVDEMVLFPGVAADGDGQLPDSEDPQHAELSRLKRPTAGSVLGPERKREGVGRFLRHVVHAVGLRSHRIGG